MTQSHSSSVADRGLLGQIANPQSKIQKSMSDLTFALRPARPERRLHRPGRPHAGMSYQPSGSFSWLPRPIARNAFESCDHHQIDDLEAAGPTVTVHNHRASCGGQSHEILVLYFQMAAIRDMNCERAKRLRVQQFANLIDSHQEQHRLRQAPSNIRSTIKPLRGAYAICDLASGVAQIFNLSVSHRIVASRANFSEDGFVFSINH
jgi:hypothetical protein